MTGTIKPEQKMQDTESSGSVIGPDQNAQTTEAYLITDQNALRTEANIGLDKNAQTTEANMVTDQNALATEANTNTDQNTQMTEAQLREGSSSDTIPDPIGKQIYRCKKCRQIVASDENLVSHEQGNGEASFKVRKKSVEQNAPECTAIFVEPLKWMVPVQEGYLSEKLYCIGCKSKLGFFTWVGMQCSCGAWVRPAFQIHKSRVDECRI